ncbi:unnamed protein product [Paramecium sonneborni]|uniref:Uncharacterized protein n=1 Tax=Paramecium sonneborni TaxID=65129 RepID=A0A8S1R6U1_9CILI|nr:unnamed protein product [Paramecium sonneborni]
MSDQQQKSESQDNSSLQSSQDEQQQKTIKPVELITLPKVYPQSVNNEQPSTREEKKIKQYLQRIQEQERQEEVATQKKKRFKVNPPLKQQDNLDLAINAENGDDEGSLLIPPTIQLNPQVLQTEQQSEIQTQQLKMRLNPKLKIKEKHHVYIYLANCQDESLEGFQQQTSRATQFYSPQKQLKDQSSLNQINQDIFQETTIIIKNIKNQYQQYIDQISHGYLSDQKDFFSKYLDKKYIESVLRDNKMQIQKKQINDKQPQTGKQIPKKY